ncbi:MAG: hypothetical protein A2542_03810 [Parcubacteria group bacterium RIFOXYD2_FULL_52_8]|nr:MAG: hypothetical protein A2542_03810 [Parcubacteria group bacterium RIFOXYD2_FULL_52_8]
MSFDFQYAYLVGVLLFLPFWLACLWYRKDLRREILIVSLVFGIIAWSTEPLFLRDYWQPLYWKSLSFTWNGSLHQLGSLEDFLYGFFKGGIAAAIYEVIFGQHYTKRHIRTHHWLLLLIPFFGIGIPLFIAPIFLFGANSLYAALISCFFCILIYLFFRRDLFLDAFVSGILVGLISFCVLLVFSVLFRGIFDVWWQLDSLSGHFIAGIPIEEFLESFAIGALLGPFYEFFAGLSFAHKSKH